MEKSDIKYIIEILQDELPENNVSDWYGVLGFLELNKISGYFYNKVKEKGISLPQNIDRKLNAILKIQSERNFHMRIWLNVISYALKDLTDIAFLKGSILSNVNLFFNKPDSCKKPIYYDGERISNDIDILIKPKDITYVTRVLKDMGFVQGYYDFKYDKIIELDRKEIIMRRMNRGETVPFLLKLDNAILPFIEIDINFSVDYLPAGNAELLNDMLSDTVLYQSAYGFEIRSLNPEHFLLHLIMHQYKESALYSMVKRNKDLELYKLLDIYLLLVKGNISYEIFTKYVKKYGLEKEINYVFSTMSKIFDLLDMNFLLNGIARQIDCGVIDPENKNKNYKWTADIPERLLYFDKTPFLCEVADE